MENKNADGIDSIFLGINGYAYGMELWRKVRRIYYGIQEFRRRYYCRCAKPTPFSRGRIVGVGVHRGGGENTERPVWRVVLRQPVRWRVIVLLCSVLNG